MKWFRLVSQMDREKKVDGMMMMRMIFFEYVYLCVRKLVKSTMYKKKGDKEKNSILIHDRGPPKN